MKLMFFLGTPRTLLSKPKTVFKLHINLKNMLQHFLKNIFNYSPRCERIRGY